MSNDSPLGKAYEAKKSKNTFFDAPTPTPWHRPVWPKQLGFGAIKTCQTIFKLPKEMSAVEPVQDGYGEGGFVVIAAQKEVKT